MKKWYAGLAAMALLFFSGCSNGEVLSNEPVKLTWWVPLFQHVERTMSNFAQSELYQELMKRTGVEIEFIHPKGDGAFNILLASENLPDLIESSFLSYNGGPQAALDDNFIIALDPYLEKYSPNYYSVLKQNPQWDKEVTTDSGIHYTYAWIRGDESLLYWKGPQIRKDLLDRAGLAVPETLEEWEIMLRKFQEMGVKYPLTFQNASWNTFLSPFGVVEGYYQVDGTVHFGPLEPGYKDYVLLMKRWYDEGLLDAEYFLQSEKLMESKVSSGQAGAYIGSVGGNMGNCIRQLQEQGASLVGAPIPVLNRGDVVFQSERDYYYQAQTSVSISADCENVEAAARLLDYGYSHEGHMLYNFGIEGVSYEIEDGYPKYTQCVTNDPDGLSIQYAMSRYMASAYGGPFIQDKREYEQYLYYPEQKEAVGLWSRKAGEDHLLPLGAMETGVGDLANVVYGYWKDEVTKFITGQRPMEEYDAFVEILRHIGAEKVIQAKQEALDRYNQK